MSLSLPGDLLEIVLANLINIPVAIIIFFVGRWVASVIAGMVNRLLVTRETDAPLRHFLVTIVRLTLTFVSLVAALEFLGFDTTVLLTVFAAASLAIGLAVKDTLSNFAAGVMLIVFKPFTIGDFIEAAGVAGVVESIGIFSSQMKTGDNRVIIVPNSHIYGDVIINASAKPTRRIDLTIGVGYNDDLQKAEQLLLQCIAADERILAEPVAVVAVAELADSSVNFVVRPWVNSADYWAVRWHLIRQIKLSFDENGISIPYPQQDIHIHQVATD
jgi:small conductance mechanosensitive channel